MLLEFLAHRVLMVRWGQQANKVFLGQLVRKVSWVQWVLVVLQVR